MKIEQAVFFVVDVYRKEMQGIQGRDFENTEGRNGVGQAQLGREIADAFHALRMADGDAPRWKLKRFGDAPGEIRRQRSAADEQNGLRIGFIQFFDLLGDGAGKFTDVLHDRVDDLGGAEVVVGAENVVKGDVASLGGFPLDALGDVKVEEKFLRNSFGDFVPSLRNHAVGDDGAVFRDGDVGGAGADVDENEIQVPHGRRDEDVDGGDRLEGNGLHLKVCSLESRHHGVDDLPRQEGGDDGGFSNAPALTD